MNLPISVDTVSGAAPSAAMRSLTVEIFFDFVCPWCLIGKRHLDTAVRRLAEVRPDVRPRLVWRSHALLPETPMGGLPYQAFYVARLGSPEAVSRRRAQVQQAGAAAQVQFAFDRIQVLPNTAKAHAWVARTHHARQARLVDRIFSAYFLEGEDIGNGAVLERLAVECDLDVEVEVGDTAGVCAGSPASTRYPIPGVPFFVANGTLALSGATPSEALLDFMLRAVEL